MAQAILNPFDIIINYLEEQERKLTLIEFQLMKINQGNEIQNIPPDDLSVSDAAILSIQKARPMKKSSIYKETSKAQKGKSNFPVKKFGIRVVIPRKEFLEWLENNTKEVNPVDEEITKLLVKQGKKKLRK